MPFCYNYWLFFNNQAYTQFKTYRGLLSYLVKREEYFVKSISLIRGCGRQAGTNLHFSLTAEIAKTAEKTEVRKQKTEKTEI